jgi:hypothetical protein
VQRSERCVTALARVVVFVAFEAVRLALDVLVEVVALDVV